MKQEYSAGGIVYKIEGSKILILVCQHSQHHGWVFPKGLIGDSIENESKENTAIREVKEETGIDAEILEKLDPVSYLYQFKGQKIKKTVYYFLMKHIEGDTSIHDDEMENVEYLEIDRVLDRLTYSSDKKIWLKTINKVKSKIL